MLDVDQKALAWLANCCNCGRVVDTREEAEGGDKFGAESSDGKWVCSSECWDAVFRDEGPYASPLSSSQVTRDDRQRQVAEWCAAAFGAEHQASVPQRGLRMLEEAIEAYQATGGNTDQAHKLIDYIFAKEPGNLFQELGGVGITVLALAAAAGLSADDAETTELNRVLSKPLAWFHARNKVKNDAGFDATAYPDKQP